MKPGFLLRSFLPLLLFAILPSSQAQVYLPPGGYIQDFEGLATTGAGNEQATLPAGWAFREVGSVPNGFYRGDDGTEGVGDTYSYGAAGSAERALGSIASEVCRSTYGATFVNTTGAPIRTLRISYYAEQWHTGWFNRSDSTLFSYAIGSSFQYAASWTRVPGLDMITHPTGGNFKLDGNASAHRRRIEYSLSGIEIAPDDTFSIRWQDLDRAGSSDDGVAIDDFSLTVSESDEVAPSLVSRYPLHGSYVSGAGLNAYLLFSEAVTLGTGLVQLVTFPEGTPVQSFSMADGTLQARDTAVSFVLSGLTAGQRYALRIGNDVVQDAAGNPFPGLAAGAWVFARNSATDSARPLIDTLQPRHNYSMATNYPVFRVFFNEPVRRGSGAFHLRRQGDGSILQSFAADTLELKGSQAVLRPSFVPEGAYYITADSSVVEDTAGNAFAGIPAGRWNIGISNILGVPIDNHALTVNTRTPAHRSFGAAPSRLEIYWYEYAMEGLGHLRIRRSADDSVLVQLPVTDAAVSTSQNLTTVNLPPLPGGTYYVEIEEGAFINIPGTEFKGYGRGGWQFTVTGPDGQPLVLDSLSPRNGSEGVARNARFFLYFNKGLRNQTQAVSIRRFDNDVFYVSADVSVRDTMVVLTPGRDLEWGTKYYIDVPAAHFNDLGGGYGNAALSKGDWSFTTVAPPAQYAFHFTCPGFGLPAGFTHWNASGASVWSCGAAGDTAVLSITGRTPGGASETNTDWLLSPRIDLRSMQAPALRFRSRTLGGVSRLKLMVSADYAGSGNPSAATWTEINAALPDSLSNVWALSDSIPLSRWKSQYTTLAWVYENRLGDSAARWMIADVSLESVAGAGGNPAIRVDSASLAFGFSPSGIASAPKSFTLRASGVQATLVVQAPAGFEVSTNGNAYAQIASFRTADLHRPLSLWVRFRPGAANTEYSGRLQFTLDGGTPVDSVALSGNSKAAVTGLPYIDPSALGSGLILYGNPMSDLIQVRLRQPVAGKVEVRLSGTEGKLWYRAELSGASVIRIPAADLPRGVYLITVRSGRRTTAQKVLLQ